MAESSDVHGSRAVRRTLTGIGVSALAIAGLTIAAAERSARSTSAPPAAAAAPAAMAAPAPADSIADPFELTETGLLVHVSPAANGFVMPVVGVTLEQLANSFGAPRSGERRHAGIDIAAPRGTPVVAALDGWIVMMSYSEAGGLGLHLLDRTGSLLLYYAHLDAYADDIWTGRAVRRRELLGYAGTTGNAATPHLHFGIGRVRAPGRLDVEWLNPWSVLTGRREAEPVAASP